MILLDTHIWIWWVSQQPTLTPEQQQIIEEERDGGLGVSIISC